MLLYHFTRIMSYRDMCIQKKLVIVDKIWIFEKDRPPESCMPLFHIMKTFISITLRRSYLNTIFTSFISLPFPSNSSSVLNYLSNCESFPLNYYSHTHTCMCTHPHIHITYCVHLMLLSFTCVYNQPFESL